MGTQTCTVDERTAFSVRRIAYDWLSDTNGYMSDTLETTSGRMTSGYYTGRILVAVFIPDTGDTQPDASYDVFLRAVGADGTEMTKIDLTNAGGTNLSNSATVIKTQEDKLGALCNEKLALYVEGAGASNGGLVYVYIR